MDYILTTKDKTTVKMNADQVLNLLMGRVLEDKKNTVHDLANTFTRYLEDHNFISQSPPAVVIKSSMALGYFLCMFLQKNKVEIINGTSENIDDNAIQPDSSKQD